MENMILQMAMEFAKTLTAHFFEKGIYELGDMTNDAKQMSDAFVSDLLGKLIEAADQALVDAKQERRSDGIAIHERDVKRTQFTAVGPLTYRRTYFKTPAGNEYILDNIMGVNPYERVDTLVSAAMANRAGEHSFARSADIVTGGCVSRQTAWSKTMGIGEVVSVPVRTVKTPEVLHIFADEDHVHLQDGKNAILPLVTVCAGKRAVSKSRNELIDPLHISGYGLKPCEHWSYVYAVCAEKYDMGKVRKVIIYGDAAKWIGVSSDYFPNSTYVLDEYHYRKHMKALTAGYICTLFESKLKSALKSNRKDTFQKLGCEMHECVSAQMADGEEKSKRLRHVYDECTFILAHWDEIQNRQDPDSIGSCTEALISHVFSQRFSRNPMGWSKAGLAKMSMIRVFVKNGGTIMPMHIGAEQRSGEERRVVQDRIAKYEELVQKQSNEILKDVNNWRWFKNEGEVISQGHSGTRHVLRSWGREHGICASY